jgi:hypothetical protein
MATEKSRYGGLRKPRRVTFAVTRQDLHPGAAGSKSVQPQKGSGFVGHVWVMLIGTAHSARQVVLEVCLASRWEESSNAVTAEIARLRRRRYIELTEKTAIGGIL